MRIFFFVVALFLLVKADFYKKINIEREGKNFDAIVYNFWSGEYPGVVINVQKKVKFMVIWI